MSVKQLYDSICERDRFTLISGPCVLESEDIANRVAEFIVRLTEDLPVQFIFKSSFEKANRSSSDSYRGPGIEEGLNILQKIKADFDVPVLTDIHNEMQAPLAAEVVDILQIPAFLSRQTELLEAAGRTGKIVNIKKAQFMAPEDMKLAAGKVSEVGNSKVMLTERGTFFGYRNLVVDMRNLVVMNQFGFPVIFDATHSVQLPSASDGKSGGQPHFVGPLAQAALATESISGLFLEVHPEPENALSDASSMLNLPAFRNLLKRALDLFEVTKKWEAEFND